MQVFTSWPSAWMASSATLECATVGRREVCDLTTCTCRTLVARAARAGRLLFTSLKVPSRPGRLSCLAGARARRGRILVAGWQAAPLFFNVRDTSNRAIWRGCNYAPAIASTLYRGQVLVAHAAFSRFARSPALRASLSACLSASSSSGNFSIGMLMPFFVASFGSPS